MPLAVLLQINHEHLHNYSMISKDSQSKNALQ